MLVLVFVCVVGVGEILIVFLCNALFVKFYDGHGHHEACLCVDWGGGGWAHGMGLGCTSAHYTVSVI